MRLTEHFGRQMVVRRAALGMSQRALAAHLVGLGYPMSQPTIAKIESGGTRQENVTLDEAVAISCALSTPLTAMMLPVASDETVEIVPGTEVHTWRLFEWLRCEEPLDGDDLAHWRETVVPFWSYDHVREAQKATQAAHHAARRTTAEWKALGVDNVRMVKAAAVKAYHEALADLAEAVGVMCDQGLSTKGLVARSTYDDMKALELNPTTAVGAHRRPAR